jgi:putative transposase
MFRDDYDRTAFCRRLTRSIVRYRWSCIAFVLMTTHFHLVLEVEDDVLSPGVRDFFGPYAQEFNRRHRRYGHLRAEPFKLRPVDSNSGLRVVARYVANNPVEAGMCEEPQDWLWSSYAGSAGYATQFAFVDDTPLMDTLHGDASESAELWRDFVERPNVKGTIPLTFVA